MLGEVEKSGSSMGIEVGRIEGGAAQQTVQDIKSKYGTSSISGNDQVPRDDNYIKYSVSDNEIPKKITRYEWTWEEAGISKGNAIRIQNAANKTKQTIIVVGKRVLNQAGIIM